MPTTTNMAVIAADTSVWLPAELRGPQLHASGSDLIHTHELDAQTLSAPDWCYLQVTCIAYQIHPATIADLDELGPIGGRNFRRWNVEGPSSLLPGETPNCTFKVEVAYSMAATPGSSWHEHRSAPHKMRSFKARVTITRPDASYDFRLVRFAVQATLKAPSRPDDHEHVIADIIDLPSIQAAAAAGVIPLGEGQPNNGFLRIEWFPRTSSFTGEENLLIVTDEFGHFSGSLIGLNEIENSRLNFMPPLTVKGNPNAGPGDSEPVDMTQADLRATVGDTPNIITSDDTVKANTSRIVVDDLTINSGVNLTVEAGGHLLVTA